MLTQIGSSALAVAGMGGEVDTGVRRGADGLGKDGAVSFETPVVNIKCKCGG